MLNLANLIISRNGDQSVDTESRSKPQPEAGLAWPPDWFLHDNVKIAETFRGMKPNHYIRKGTTRLRNDEATSRNPSKNRFNIDFDMYSQVRDTIASQLPFSDSAMASTGSVKSTLLQTPHVGGILFLNRVVNEVARELSMDVVTVDLEDLEDVGREYWMDQEDADERSKLPLYHFVEWYFGGYNARMPNSDDVFETLLASPSRKRKLSVPSSTPAADSGTATRENAAFPVLLHLRDACSIAKITNGDDVLQRIRMAAAKRQEERQTVIMVATATGDVSPNNTPIASVKSALDISTDAVVDLEPPKLPSTERMFDRSRERRAERAHLQQIRRCLRSLVAPTFSRNLLLPHARWKLPESEGLTRVLQRADWADGTAQRASKQIVGRCRNRSELDIRDVAGVIARIDHISATVDMWKTPKKVTGSLLLPPGLSPKLREELERIYENIRWSMPEQEQELILALFDCIIDTARLEDTFDSLAIDQSLKDDLRQLYRLHSSTTTKGLLKSQKIRGAVFYGPPGTGKTHLARLLAKESNATLLLIPGADIQSKYVGETERTIRAIFSLAAKLEPCLLFLDEADAIFRARSSGDRNYERLAINQFLVEMEGLQNRKGNSRGGGAGVGGGGDPFILVATNRPADLDEAIVRRLGRVVHLGLPDEAQRQAILRIYLRDETTDARLEVAGLARTTGGFSGSDLRTLCIEAAMQAEKAVNARGGRGGTRRIANEHFQMALRTCRKTVSPDMLDEVSRFAKKYDTGSTGAGGSAGAGGVFGRVLSRLRKARNS